MSNSISDKIIASVQTFFQGVKIFTLSIFDTLYKNLVNSIDKISYNTSISLKIDKFLEEEYVEMRHDIKEIINITAKAASDTIHVIATKDITTVEAYNTELAGIIE